MSLNKNFLRGALALSFVLTACGDDGDNTECGTGTMLVDGECVSSNNLECGAGTTLNNGECVSDAVCGTGTVLTAGMCLPVVTPPVTTYRQVEFLGRPGIAEALLITPAYLEGYNATAPSFTGAPPAAVTAISAEAKTVLKAIYLGTCLLNGLVISTPPLTAASGAKPGGLTCVEIGGAVFDNNSAVTGTTVKATVLAGAEAYANRVFSQFITDVLRIDTAQMSGGVPALGYFAGGASLCSGAAADVPLLCGGRRLNEDVIDITYFYLLAGGSVPSGVNGTNATQLIQLVTDGVFFSSNAGENSGIGLGTPDPTNRAQFHQSCANCGTPRIDEATFPYSAPPR